MFSLVSDLSSEKNSILRLEHRQRISADQKLAYLNNHGYIMIAATFLSFVFNRGLKSLKIFCCYFTLESFIAGNDMCCDLIGLENIVCDRQFVAFLIR